MAPTTCSSSITPFSVSAVVDINNTSVLAAAGHCIATYTSHSRALEFQIRIDTSKHRLTASEHTAVYGSSWSNGRTF
ncbi:hypothetical protein RvY_14338 [Ramazzottius varieornatus]|uniref:Uncharacterized protein n=1 Tax=Ramazzottius varieornatus TaxID=947166 RepID=A0A1D1VZE8_RAMVA|nr:hypothetical protein RvY_14338 [Ramazzottius varieornatus]